MLTLSSAQTIIAGALAEARARSAKPLAVMIVDGGGHPVASAREDGATYFRMKIACAKAQGAIGMGEDTRALTDRAQTNPVFFQSLSAAVGGTVIFSPGGIVIRDANDLILGAVGVSGDTGDWDERCAFAGLAAAGLQWEVGK